MRIYIPENFNIEQFEAQHQPQTQIKSYKRDKLLFILHQLSYIPMMDSRYQQEGQLIPLHSKILQQQLGNYYRQYLDCLGWAGIIETDNHYIAKEKSKAYRLSFPYGGALKEYQIADYAFKRSLEGFYSQSGKAIRLKYPYLKKWFNENLEINQQACNYYLLEELKTKTKYPYLRSRDEHGYKSPKIQYKCAQLCLGKLVNQEFYDFSVDSSGYRFHSLLTSARKALRNGMTYAGQQLCSLDIRNSQPYFSTLLFKPEFWSDQAKNKRFKKLFKHVYHNNTIIHPSIMFSIVSRMQAQRDVQRYMNLVQNGELYEFFITEYRQRFNRSLNREAIKTELFSVLFSKNNTQNRGKELFKELFPTVDKLFRMIKTKQNNLLALLLQRIESEMILEEVCKAITERYPDAPIYTIHDSVATTYDYVEAVEEILVKTLEMRLGIPPKLKQEVWCLENLERDLMALKQRIEPAGEGEHKIAA
jgi:hypothetical protein